jgi:hypothetical protein
MRALQVRFDRRLDLHAVGRGCLSAHLGWGPGVPPVSGEAICTASPARITDNHANETGALANCLENTDECMHATVHYPQLPLYTHTHTHTHTHTQVNLGSATCELAALFLGHVWHAAREMEYCTLTAAAQSTGDPGIFARSGSSLLRASVKLCFRIPLRNT